MVDEVLYTYIDADDSVPITKLKLGEQIRMLMRRITYNPAVELGAEDVVTEEYLRLKADLMDFINRSVDSIRRGLHKNVTLSISSKFAVVFDDVVSSPELTNYFNVYVAKPKLDYDIPADILVRIEVKEGQALKGGG